MSPISIFKNKRNTEQTKSSLKLFVPNKKSKVAFTLAEVFSTHFKNNRKYAYTLAEVLITLGIIGVVAALTLPTLIQHHQKKQTVTQLKKAYSELSQAINMAQVDYGTPEDWDFADFETPIERAAYFGDKYLFPYLKVVRKCIPSSNECWADDVKTIGDKSAYINSASSKEASVSFVTATGYSVYYWLHEGGTGGWFYVDINGYKNMPNKFGKDIFPLYLVNDVTIDRKSGFHVYGVQLKDNLTREDLISETQPYACNRNITTSTAGLYCGGLIVLDGWKISDDYPW